MAKLYIYVVQIFGTNIHFILVTLVPRFQSSFLFYQFLNLKYAEYTFVYLHLNDYLQEMSISASFC